MKLLQAGIYTIAIVVLVDTYLAEQDFVWLSDVRLVLEEPWQKTDPLECDCQVLLLPNSDQMRFITDFGGS
jgi:hypothetical protein